MFGRQCRVEVGRRLSLGEEDGGARVDKAWREGALAYGDSCGGGPMERRRRTVAESELENPGW